jgi:hypothetical protein
LLSGHIATLVDSLELFQAWKTFEESLRVANMWPLNNP